MKKFFRQFLATFISTLACLVILPAALFAVLLFFAASLVEETGASAFDAENIDEEAPVAVLNLSRPIIEGAGSARFSLNFFGKPGLSEPISTFQICRYIRAEADLRDTTKALLIYGNLPEDISLAQVEEVRAAIEYFASKKRVVAYLENPSQKEYYLASAASEIALNPASDFTFKGIAATPIFFGDALKKYGVEAQVIKSGAHKNFGAVFTENKLSPSDKQLLEGVLNSIWQDIAQKISKSRKMPLEKLRQAAEQTPLMSAEDAVSRGFADELLYADELSAKLAAEYGADGKSFRRKPLSRVEPFGESSIAVVYMSGDIVEGSLSNSIDTSRYLPLLKDLRRDKQIKAIVLRIDSGGGSAYASEILRREVELAAREKPVVVSMGGACASGAYWLASPAAKAFADGATITGSIGVVSVLFSGKKFAADWGVTFDAAKTSPYADIFSGARPATPGELAIMRPLLEKIYRKFVQIVSDARKIPLQDARTLADGRIFTGLQAVALGLADARGGVIDAVECAKNLAKLEDFRVEQYPQTNPLKEMLGLAENADIFAKYPALKRLLRLAETPQFKSGFQASMPFSIKID